MHLVACISNFETTEATGNSIFRLMAGKKTNCKTVKCDVPQGSILGPLLFLLYINDLQFASDLLDPIMFADNTNLFYSNKDKCTVFSQSK